MRIATIFLFLSLLIFSFCTTKSHETTNEDLTTKEDSLKVEEEEAPKITIDDIIIRKDLSYDQHTLEDVYPYKDTTRMFQWDKVRERLFYLDSIQTERATWGIIKNYKNLNKEAPLVKNYKRNAYNRVADTLGTERYQSVPLHLPTDSDVPELYGRDGSLVKVLEGNDTTKFVKIENMNFPGEWLVPQRYIKIIGDTVVFKKAIFVDRINQNIATLEKTDTAWVVRSMNPATTGVHRPPYAQETPIGLFVVQEKKSKMIFLKDGSTETGGFAPWASRFTNGAYIHGVPINAPRTAMVEFSSSLGTTPRSHMCVRNATSHAKFIYDWANIEASIVFIFD